MNNNIIETIMELKAQGFTTEQITTIIGTMKPAKGGKGNSAKAEKPKKVYVHFEKQFDGFNAVSVASKGENPDAVLTVTFDSIPDDKVRYYLKGCGFKYNGETKVWYRDNVDFAQKALDLVSMVK